MNTFIATKNSYENTSTHMQSTYDKKELIIAFFLSFILLGVYSWISPQEARYLVEEYTAFDSSLFPDSIWQLGNAVSAKYLSEAISGILFHVFKWETTRFLYYILSISILSFAYINFCIRWKMSSIIRNVLLMDIMSVLVTTGNLGSFCIFNAINRGYQSLGISLGIMAISFCFGSAKWNTAFCLSAIACIAHVHFGIYSFSFICLLLFIHIIQNKKIACKKVLPGLIICCTAILISVIPPLVTSQNIYTGREYFNNTGYLRPHISPVVWGNFNIFNQYLIYISIFIFCYLYAFYNKEPRSIKNYLFHVAGIIITFSLIILLSCIFVDIHPVRFIANLMMSKYFIFCDTFCVVLLTYTLDKMLKDTKFCYIAAGLILLLPLGAQWCVLTLIPAGILWLHCGKAEKSEKISDSVIFLIIAVIVVLFFYIKNNNITIGYNNNAAYWGCLMVSGILIEQLIRHPRLQSMRGGGTNKPRLKYSAIIISLLLIFDLGYWGTKVTYHKDDGSLAIKGNTYYVQQVATSDICTIATKLSEISTKDSMVLANDRESFANGAYPESWLQCLAKRSVYVTNMALNKTDAGLIEHRKREERIANWDNYSVDDFYTTMIETGCDYIFLDKEDKQKIEHSEQFSCIIDTSTYALYQILK